jgi:Zn-dependent alcohol dehydrogenase
VKAAVCRSFGAALEIEEVTIRPPGPGEVSVRVAACAICHSDIAFIDGAWGGPLPAVYGHEAAGVVTETGPGVAGVAGGDHVVVTLIRSCGRCARCLRDQPSLCEGLPDPDTSPVLAGAAGEAIHQGMRTGAFARLVTVDASQVVTVPTSVPLDAACLLACGVMTGVGAVMNTAVWNPAARSWCSGPVASGSIASRAARWRGPGRSSPSTPSQRNARPHACSAPPT